MSGLEHLIEKILSDARDEAARATEAGQAEAASIVADCQRKAEAEKTEVLRKAVEEAAARKAQLISAAELSVRDKKLAAKQQLIERVLTAATQKLNDMDDRQYAAFLSKQLSGLELPEGAEIVVPRRYREKLDLGAVHPRLRLSASDRRVDGGFILMSPDAESNNTFEALLGNGRAELEKIIAERMF